MSYKASDMNQAKTPSWLVRRVAAPRVAPIGHPPTRGGHFFFLALANSKLLPLGSALSLPLTRAR